MTYFKLRYNNSLPPWILTNGIDTLRLTGKNREVIKWGRNHKISHSVTKYNHFYGKYVGILFYGAGYDSSTWGVKRRMTKMHQVAIM